MTITDKHASELMGVAQSEAMKHLNTDSGDFVSHYEDIAQDALVSLLEREAEGKVDNEFVAFSLIKQIVHQTCTKLIRDETRRREIEQEHGESINNGLDGSREYLSADPLEIMAYEEMRSRLDELSPKLYNAVERHYIDGRSVTSIAEEDGVSEDVVYKRLQRARDVITGDNNNE